MWVHKQRNFQCVVCACYLTSSCQTPLTWHTSRGLMISSVFSFSLLLAFSIISVLSSSVWCQQFSQQVSLFSWNQETSTSLQVYLIPDGIWHREMWWNCSQDCELEQQLLFFKPVQRATDKEYLPPRSSGLLQLCTLTGATSRLSQS